MEPFIRRSSTRQGSPARRLGVALIVVVVVIMLVIGGAAAYYVFVFSAPVPNGVPGKTTTAVVGTTTTNGNFKRYAGTFTFSTPLGPTGEDVSPNGTLALYSSVVSATGTFSFFINPTNQSGSGSGTGRVTSVTTGFCTGQTSFAYSFTIPDATTLLGSNLTVAFGDATPSSGAYPLSCRALNGTVYSTTGNFTYLSVYPNLISVSSVPSTQTFSQSGISYMIQINNAP